MCSKFIKLIVLLSLLVCCGFAGRVLYSRFVRSFSRTRERSTSQGMALGEKKKQNHLNIFTINSIREGIKALFNQASVLKITNFDRPTSHE